MSLSALGGRGAIGPSAYGTRRGRGAGHPLDRRN